MFRPIRLTLPLALLAGPALTASTLLWELGRPDNANADLALAPSGYAQFRDDGFFIVGQSDPQSAWPYVHPGPADAWAGNQAHTFTVLFQLDQANPSETARLRLDFLDTHAGLAPRLRVTLNGHAFERALPPGGGDASINGDAARGRECIWELDLPPGSLRLGENHLELTTLSGSWLLYDSVQLFASADTRLAPVPPGTRLSQITVAPYWLHAPDGPVQPVQLRLQHIGAAAEAQVRIGDRPPLPVRLQSGWQSIEVTAPAAEHATRVPSKSLRRATSCSSPTSPSHRPSSARSGCCHTRTWTSATPIDSTRSSASRSPTSFAASNSPRPAPPTRPACASSGIRKPSGSSTTSCNAPRPRSARPSSPRCAAATSAWMASMPTC
ncbi:MAG: polysaccharide lyase family protein [Verrucomicrobia bacterium]|nr:polysaccharide lyase family protein [Verrucomicrobiota bacterium]